MYFRTHFRKYIFCRNLLAKSFSAGINRKLLVECLNNRALIRIHGDEVQEYLQGLLTNDMKRLQFSPNMYAMFLNSRGRVLYDTIIYNVDGPKTYFIECDTSAVNPLMKHLLMYKVRRKINVESVESDFKIWIVCNKDEVVNSEELGTKNVVEVMKGSFKHCLICQDPRLANLGIRLVAKKEVDVPSELKKMPSFKILHKSFYKSLRYELGVGEGVNELPPGNCFPLEANCDYLHGVSFDKGCYIGQELTARTYHTGVIRKRLMPVIFNHIIDVKENNIPIFTASSLEKPVGKLRGIEGNLGIGLLRVQEALKASELCVTGKSVQIKRPLWWPNEAQRE